MAGGAHSPKKSGGRKAWFWILGAVIVALVIALVVVLLTGDDDDDKPTTTSTTAAATTTTVPSTTTPPTTTTVPATTTTVVLPVITDDPQTYAEYLFAAWQNDNRTDAANVASADAVTSTSTAGCASTSRWPRSRSQPEPGGRRSTATPARASNRPTTLPGSRTSPTGDD